MPFVVSQESIPYWRGLRSHRRCGRAMPKKLQVDLEDSGQYIGLQRVGVRSEPCNAGEEVVGDCAKVSRSRRMDDDCFKAELNSEFCICQSCKFTKSIIKNCAIPSCQCGQLSCIKWTLQLHGNSIAVGNRIPRLAGQQRRDDKILIQQLASHRY